MIRLTRRGLLQTGWRSPRPHVVRAQGAPLYLGVLTPLTGAGEFRRAAHVEGDAGGGR